MPAVKKPKLAEVRVIRTSDQNPDMSFLGEYSNHPAKIHIDRQEKGDWTGPREYRYFNAGDGDPAYIEQDYARYEAYNRGEWQMVGVWAEAEVIINNTVQKIRSGGLWGIESDAGEYLDEVAQEQLNELRDILASMDVRAPKWKSADVKIKDR